MEWNTILQVIIVNSIETVYYSLVYLLWGTGPYL